MKLIQEGYSGHAYSLGSSNGSVQAGFSSDKSIRAGRISSSLSMPAHLMVASGVPPNI